MFDYLYFISSTSVTNLVFQLSWLIQDDLTLSLPPINAWGLLKKVMIVIAYSHRFLSNIHVPSFFLSSLVSLSSFDRLGSKKRNKAEIYCI